MIRFLIERQVLRHAGRPAVKTRHQTLTYRELNTTTNKIARAILARRGEGEEAIALMLEPDVLAAAAILGVLKAGKVAVSLDLALPPLRRADMPRDAAPGLVLTSDRYASATSALCETGPDWLDLDALDDPRSDENVDLAIAPDAPCCIYYTSGSTGRPKGVVQTHRNVLHAMMNYTNSLWISPEDRLALLHSYSFAASLTSFFGALLNGAALLPFDLAHEGLTPLADEAGREVPPGEVGEIVVRSRYLSPGYWRQPALTAAAFHDDPSGGPARLYRTGDLGSMADGCLTHHGRTDSQVKVRGHRVDVGEVEAALREHPALKDVVVVPRQDRSNAMRLVAYVVAHTPPAPSSSALRRFLSEKLHEYMVPSAFVPLAALPLTSNDKVDVRLLPAPGRARPTLAQAFAPPRTPIEEKVAAIWAEVLDLERVGIHDSFLELGGNSLLVTEIISRISDCFGAALPLGTLLAAPTVADVALAITHAHASEVGQERMTDMLAELAPRPDGGSIVGT